MNTTSVITQNIPQKTPIDVIVEISSIVEAKKNINKIKKNIKNSGLANKEKLVKNLQSASDMVSEFGMFDDCGPSYEEDYTKAKANLEYFENNFNNVVPTLIIQPEKHLKKRIHEFKEKYPLHVSTLENIIKKVSELSQKNSLEKDKIKGEISNLSSQIFNIINNNYCSKLYNKHGLNKKNMVHQMSKNDETFHKVINYILNNEVENYIVSEEVGMSIPASDIAKAKQANKNKKRYEEKIIKIKELYEKYCSL